MSGIPSSCALFCVGHPLLDILHRTDVAFLQKYNLKANDGILATSARHLSMYAITGLGKASTA